MSTITPPSGARTNTAVLVLAFCCLCWGYSFPVMKLAMDRFEEKAVLTHAVKPQALNPAGEPAGELPLLTKLGINATFNGWRFGLTTLVYFALTYSKQIPISGTEKRGGIWIGALFFVGMFAQLTGLRYTLPSISSFLTALVVVFAPLAQSFLFRKPVSGRVWLAVGVAVLGTVVLAQPNQLAEPIHGTVTKVPFPYMGEILTIIGSVFFTGQLLALDHYGQNANPARLTFFMFLSTGLLSTILGLLLGGTELYALPLLHALATDWTIIWSILSMTVFSSVLAVHLMTTYQPQISPAVASVVYCLEPLFATLFSVLFATERLTPTTLAGGCVILFAVLIVAQRKQ